ncbi:MAG: hypothetical protein ACKVPX_01555 [Myxococcaceae bacterium]
MVALSVAGGFYRRGFGASFEDAFRREGFTKIAPGVPQAELDALLASPRFAAEVSSSVTASVRSCRRAPARWMAEVSIAHAPDAPDLLIVVVAGKTAPSFLDAFLPTRSRTTLG